MRFVLDMDYDSEKEIATGILTCDGKDYATITAPDIMTVLEFSKSYVLAAALDGGV